MMAGTALNSNGGRPRSGDLSAPSSSIFGEVLPFESIYRQYFDLVWCLVRRLGVSAASVDDVVQEVFIVIHARLPTVYHPDALRSWIYGIARRTVSSHYRARRVREAFGAALAVEPSVQPLPRTPLELVEQNDQVKLLFSLLEELDEPKREVFMMAELDQLTVPEIAEALELPLNTAYSRLRRARHAFEEALAHSKRPAPSPRAGTCFHGVARKSAAAARRTLRPRPV
jgi:RNA polymerase sigma-70 factor (ECF subfamily)